jgi:hypothetical protein
VRPSSVSTAVNVGDRAPLPSYAITFAGDLTQLSGRTVYVLVEDAGGVVEGEPQLAVVGDTVRVGLAGVVLDAVETRAGELVFHACYDLACVDELPGSPTTAHYTFDVRPGLVVEAPDTIDLGVDFGTDPPPITIPVTLPVGASTVEVTRTLCLQDYVNLSDSNSCSASVLSQPAPSTSGPLVVNVDPTFGWPGTYTDTVRISATSDIAGYRREFSRELDVRYTIRAEGGPSAILAWQPVWGGPAVVIDPAVGIDVDVADANLRYLQLGAYTKAGFLWWTSVDYPQGVPAGGDPQAPYESWFSSYGGSSAVAACMFYGQDRHCMAPGNYAATAHGTIDGDPTAQVTLPIRMRVLPIP